MAKATAGSFIPDSGLIDNFDATITAAIFKPNPEYAKKAANMDPDTPLLHLTFEGPAIETEDGVLIQAYSIGGNWEAKGKGSEVTNVRNPDKLMFNSSSNTGIFVKKVLSILGEGDEMKGANKLADRGTPMTKAEFYIGIAGHFSREAVTRQAGGTFTGGTTSVLLPADITAMPGIIGGKKVKGKKAAAEEDAPKGGNIAADDEGEGKSEDNFADHIAWLTKTAPGNTRRKLKAAAATEYGDGDKTDDDFVESVVNGGMINDLIKSGVLEIDDDGAFVAPE